MGAVLLQINQSGNCSIYQFLFKTKKKNNRDVMRDPVNNPLTPAMKTPPPPAPLHIIHNFFNI